MKQRQSSLTAALGLLGLALIGACDPSGGPGDSAPPSARAPEDPPARVVSLSPLASQFLLRLDAGHLLVGVDAISQRLVGLESLPVVGLLSAAELAPDIVLLATLPPSGHPDRLPLETLGAKLVEFQPNDLEDVSALYQGLGARLVGHPAALRAEASMLRPLAQIGGSSFGRRRPRTLAIVRLEPLVLAGAHSFETDLIEIAGGNSVTHAHGGNQVHIESTPARLESYAPELLLVVDSETPSPEQRRVWRQTLGDRYPIEFLRVEPRAFWLEDPPTTAQRLHEVIERLSRALAAEAP